MSLEITIIDAISFSLPHFTKTHKGWKFQCPYCQHGLRDYQGRHYGPGRVKGNFYQDKNRVVFHCFLCGEHKEFHSFLHDHFPKQLLEYVRRREELGLTGYQTNCPTLKTVLKNQGVLPQHPPAFNKQNCEDAKHPPTHIPAPAVPPSIPAATKVTKLPPMRSPQQQAGHQSQINNLLKKRKIFHRDIQICSAHKSSQHKR